MNTEELEQVASAKITFINVMLKSMLIVDRMKDPVLIAKAKEQGLAELIEACLTKKLLLNRLGKANGDNADILLYAAEAMTQENAFLENTMALVKEND